MLISKISATKYTFLFEISFRGTLALSALLATFLLDPSQIGQVTLAGSLGLTLSSLTNGNWASRLQYSSKYHLNSQIAAKEFLFLNFFSFLLLAIFFVISNILNFSNFFLLFFITSIIYTFVNLNELLWGIAGKNNLTQRISAARFYSSIMGASLGILFFVVMPNQYSYLLPHFLIWFIVTLLSIFLLFSFHFKEILLRFFEGRFFPTNATVSLISYNLLINLSMIIDNLILGFVQNASQVAVYSMAFGVCSLFVTIIGSTFQRLYSVEQSNFIVSKRNSSYFVAILILTIIFSFLSLLTSDSTNEIFRNTPRILLILIPSIFFRIKAAKYSAVLSRFGSIKENYLNTCITLSLLIILGFPLSHTYGAYGMAIATSLTYYVMVKYLAVKIKKIESDLNSFSLE